MKSLSDRDPTSPIPRAKFLGLVTGPLDEDLARGSGSWWPPRS
ncbi:MAG: hypothetical protein ABEL97_02315 [Salinibacter sp.]